MQDKDCLNVPKDSGRHRLWSAKYVKCVPVEKTMPNIRAMCWEMLKMVLYRYDLQGYEKGWD